MEPRWPRLVLGALVLLPALVFAWRAVTQETPSALPLERPWVDQLWITAGDWPVTGGEPVFASGMVAEGRVLGTFAARSTRLAQAYAPSLDPAVNAASLLTGLWPTTLGFLERGGKVDPAVWTVPTAARAHGARTSAFLQDLFVTDLGLLGFDKSVEGSGLSNQEIVDAVTADWQKHPDQPAWTWIHLSEAGDGAANVRDLLERLELGALDEDRRASSLIVIAGLSARVTDPPASPIVNDDRFRVPLLMALPGDLAAGRQGVGSASLVDVPWAVVEVAKWRQPVPPMEGRTSVIAAMQGSVLPEWCLMIGPEGHVLRRDNERFFAPGLPPAKLPDVSVCVPGGDGFVRSDNDNVVRKGRMTYRELVEELLKL